MPSYAVARGRKVGVFAAWPECEAQVKGFTGARFKKFATQAEALAFVEEHRVGGSSGAARASTSAQATNSKAGSKRKAGAVESEGAGKPAAKSRRTSSGAVTTSSSSSSSSSATASSSARLIKVYTDGACSANGKSGAKAGWGVYFHNPELQHLNESKRLPGALQTNNRAELMALIRACQLCPDDEARLEIYTDSQYSMKAINEWQRGWRKKGWINSSGQPVMNKDLIRRLERELRARKIRPTLIYVRGHKGDVGNERADRLAVAGATMPAVPRNEWVDEEPSDSE